jgi:hypothetical protein
MLAAASVPAQQQHEPSSKPTARDKEVANKLRSDAMMRVGSPVDTIAAYRAEIEAASVPMHDSAMRRALIALAEDWATRPLDTRYFEGNPRGFYNQCAAELLHCATFAPLVLAPAEPQPDISTPKPPRWAVDLASRWEGEQAGNYHAVRDAETYASDLLAAAAIGDLPLVLAPAEPQPDAPTDISQLPDYWDERRRKQQKPDLSRCAAELRIALDASTDEAWIQLTADVSEQIRAKDGERARELRKLINTAPRAEDRRAALDELVRLAGDGHE